MKTEIVMIEQTREDAKAQTNASLWETTAEATWADWNDQAGGAPTSTSQPSEQAMAKNSDDWLPSPGEIEAGVHIFRSSAMTENDYKALEFENIELRRRLQIANRAVDKLREHGERLQATSERMQAEIIKIGGSW